MIQFPLSLGFPGGSAVKNPPEMQGWQEMQVQPLDQVKIPGRRKWQPTSVFLSEESRGQRSLAGYNLWGRQEPNMT